MLDELLGKVDTTQIKSYWTMILQQMHQYVHTFLTNITYYSNHSAKSFHYKLNKIKSLSCKCKKEGKKCKCITESLVDRTKTALCILIFCEVDYQTLRDNLTFIATIAKTSMIPHGVSFIQQLMMMVVFTPQSHSYFALYSLKHSQRDGWQTSGIYH